MSDPAPYAVIDIDGVLADVAHRVHHLEARPKRWDAFFDAAARDAPWPEGLAVARRLADGHDLVYLSGRPERIRGVTQDWMRRHDVPAGELRLRPHRDFRPARTYKVEVLRRLATIKPVAVLVDDDLDVCQAARDAGFEVLHADWAYADPTLFDAQERLGRT